VDWVTFSHLEETGLVAHGFSTRKGGVSEGLFGTLNLGFFGGDIRERVLENRRRAAGAFRADMGQMVMARQVHGVRVHQARAADRGRGVWDEESMIPETDALITDIPGVLLVTFHADCVPIFFLDPRKKAIGLAHAGWKGSIAGIAGETVRAMEACFGSRPAHLLAGIGPSIGPCHYEVDDPVTDLIKEVFGRRIQPWLYPGESPGKAFLDLWALNTQILEQAGVLKAHIEVSALCTLCHKDRFFSHRAGMKGRQAAMMMLSPFAGRREYSGGGA
jgi:YfiH family protein